jgi:hypothetical protein
MSELTKYFNEKINYKVLNVFGHKECLDPMRNLGSKISLLVQKKPLGFITVTTTELHSSSSFRQGPGHMPQMHRSLVGLLCYPSVLDVPTFGASPSPRPC